MEYFSLTRMPPSQFIYMAKRPKTGMHRQVERILSSLDMKFESEYDIHGILGDFAFPETRLLLEIEDRSKAFRGSKRILGHVLFRRRILKKLGWKIIRIKYWVWEGLTTPQREKYLTDELRRHSPAATPNPFSTPETTIHTNNELPRELNTPVESTSYSLPEN